MFQASITMLGALALARVSGSPSHKAANFIATNPGAESSAGTEGSQKMFEVIKTEAQWREVLSPEQFNVLRQHGTEWAGSSPLDREYRDGTYHCAGCDLPLFSSQAKFDSQTGWPSFYEPIEGATATSEDYQYDIHRTEVHCRRCGGHLGHVFLDGPPPTGERFCINGVALKFVPV